MEKRQQEKCNSQKVSKRTAANPQQERREELDFREELKQRSNRGIDVASLEERLGSKSTAKYSPKQQDFRHLLRQQTDPSTTKLDSNTTANSTRAAVAVNHHDKRKQHVHGAGIHHLSPRHQEGRIQTESYSKSSKVSGKRDTAAAASAVNHQRHQQYHPEANSQPMSLHYRHQDRGRISDDGDHDGGVMRPGFRGGGGDRFQRSEVRVQEEKGVAGNTQSRLHASPPLRDMYSRARQQQQPSTAASNQSRDHQGQLDLYDRNQGLEETGLNYDFETQF